MFIQYQVSLVRNAKASSFGVCRSTKAHNIMRHVNIRYHFIQGTVLGQKFCSVTAHGPHHQNQLVGTRNEISHTKIIATSFVNLELGLT